MYFIKAKTKFNFQDKYKDSYAGVDIDVTPFSTGYSCFIQGMVNTPGVKSFETADQAANWYEKEKHWLLKGKEVKDVSVVELKEHYVKGL